jgi:hypothetical protein
MESAADREAPRIRRPLANAHWSLPVAIVAGWQLFIVARSCSPSGRGTEGALLLATVLVMAWVNHLRVHALVGGNKLVKIVTGTLVDIAKLLIAFIVCIVPVAIFMPSYDCMTPKARTAEILLSASRARNEITERAERAGSLKGAGIDVTVEAISQPTASMVSDDGTVMVTGGDPLVVYVLQPTLADGHVTWHCTGMPKALVLGACR